MRRLLAEEGISYYFDHSGDAERMVIIDNPLDFPEAKTPIDLIETAGVVPSTEAITSFRLTRARVSGKVTLRSSDLTRRAIAVDANRTEPRDDKAKGDPGYAEIYDGAAHFVPHGYDRGEGVYRHDNLESQALLRLEEQVQRERQSSGTGFVVGFQAGIVVWLDVPSGHAGKFLLTKVVHRGQDHRSGAQPGGSSPVSSRSPSPSAASSTARDLSTRCMSPVLVGVAIAAQDGGHANQDTGAVGGSGSAVAGKWIDVERVLPRA